MDERDIEWQACRGSGAGGQNRNKRDTAVQAFHRPSGLMVRAETERSQLQNRETAVRLLRTRLAQEARDKAIGDRAADRKAQVGCGARGDKEWTVRTQDDVVTHHASGRKFRLKDYLRGEW